MFQNGVTPVNFSGGRPTVAWGWTDLGHQGSMSVFTRNKCYHILDLFRITSPHYHQSQILTQPLFLGPWFSKVSFECRKSTKETFLLNHYLRKMSRFYEPIFYVKNSKRSTKTMKRDEQPNLGETDTRIEGRQR